MSFRPAWSDHGILVGKDLHQSEETSEYCIMIETVLKHVETQISDDFCAADVSSQASTVVPGDGEQMSEQLRSHGGVSKGDVHNM